LLKRQSFVTGLDERKRKDVDDDQTDMGKVYISGICVLDWSLILLTCSSSCLGWGGGFFVSFHGAEEVDAWKKELATGGRTGGDDDKRKEEREGKG
jgi:hypothetical protein